MVGWNVFFLINKKLKIKSSCDMWQVSIGVSEEKLKNNSADAFYAV